MPTPKTSSRKSRVKTKLTLSPPRLVTKDACTYMAMGVTKFNEEAIKKGLTVSAEQPVLIYF